MRKKKWWLLLAGVVIILAVYVLYPETNKNQRVNFQDAKDIVTSTQDQLKEIKNYKLSIEINAGSIVKVSMTDVVDRQETKRQLVEMSWDAPQNNGQTTMYSDGQQVLVLNPANNNWVRPKEDPTATPYLDFFWGQLSMADPVEAFMKLDPNNKKVAVIEKKDTIQLEVVPEPGDISDIAEHLPPQFSSAELKDLKQIFTISKDDLLITKYQVTAKVALFGITAMKFNSTTIPAEYNHTTLNLPPELTAKLNKLDS